jgi:hypothetical protein
MECLHTRVIQANRSLVDGATDILQRERPMTLRQLFYRCITFELLENNDSQYNTLMRYMRLVRENGDVPRNWLVDRTRERIEPQTYSDLGEYLEAVRHSYRRNFWRHMPCHVEIIVEKDTLAPVLEPVTRKWGVPLSVFRGYSSVSFAGEVADEWRTITRPIKAYTVGDFDPSGVDLERALKDKFQRYLPRSGSEVVLVRQLSFTDDDDDEEQPLSTEDHWAKVTWKRLAILKEDFAAYNLARVPVKAGTAKKKGDSRTPGYVADHNMTYGAEAEALPPQELRDRVERAIKSHIDWDLWERLSRAEAKERRQLDRYIDQLTNPKSTAKSPPPQYVPH